MAAATALLCAVFASATLTAASTTTTEAALLVQETTSFCGGVVTHSLGNVTSPNYPHHYDDMLHCKWLFLAPPGHRLVFQFHRHFSTELGYDRVTIQDGADAASPLMVEWSGNRSQGHLFASSDNAATVRFTTDQSLNYPGFALYYSSEPKPACGGLLLDAGGRFETPDYPAHYPSAMRCRWLIRTDDPDRRIRLTFRAFRTEPGRDVLTLLDPLADAPLLVHSGYQVPEPVTSPSNQLLVLFSSDHVVNFSGFDIDYTVI